MYGCHGTLSVVMYREERNKKAYEKLVVGNNELVSYIAKKYLGKGLSFEELQAKGGEAAEKQGRML